MARRTTTQRKYAIEPAAPAQSVELLPADLERCARGSQRLNEADRRSGIALRQAVRAANQALQVEADFLRVVAEAGEELRKQNLLDGPLEAWAFDSDALRFVRR